MDLGAKTEFCSPRQPTTKTAKHPNNHSPEQPTTIRQQPATCFFFFDFCFHRATNPPHQPEPQETSDRPFDDQRDGAPPKVATFSMEFDLKSLSHESWAVIIIYVMHVVLSQSFYLFLMRLHSWNNEFLRGDSSNTARDSLPFEHRFFNNQTNKTSYASTFYGVRSNLLRSPV